MLFDGLGKVACKNLIVITQRENISMIGALRRGGQTQQEAGLEVIQ